MREESEVISLELGLGAVFNVILLAALVCSWRQWREARRYLLMLIVGNLLEVVFTLGVELTKLASSGLWLSSDATCKFLMFMYTLGPSQSNMAVAALSLHVLLTSITGNQGDRLRHLFVMGLFVCLSFPVVVSKIPLYQLDPFSHWTDGRKKCVENSYFVSTEQEQSYHTSTVFALYFFPQIVFLVTCAVTLILHLNRNQGDEKGDISYSDLILAGLVGLVMIVCCLPYGVFVIYRMTMTDSDHHEMAVIEKDLTYLLFSRPPLSALICMVFGFVQGMKLRNFGSLPTITETNEMGETKRLVN